MTTLTVTTHPRCAERWDGRWVVREVCDRIEFVIDGQGLSAWVEATEIGSTQGEATPFEMPGTTDAVSVLTGAAPYDDNRPGDRRIPLLVCGVCGDLTCGALTVALSRHADVVQWADWAWEGHDAEAAIPLPSLPVCRFERQAYDGALREAQRRVSITPVTQVRVHRPGRRWRNPFVLPELRTDPDAMLDWLHAEPVIPALEDATGDYADFLIGLNHAQAMITGESSSRSQLPGDLQQEAVDALEALLASPHCMSLPSQTAQAAGWQLQRLSR